jgi:hypothetical protein
MKNTAGVQYRGNVPQGAVLVVPTLLEMMKYLNLLIMTMNLIWKPHFQLRWNQISARDQQITQPYQYMSSDAPPLEDVSSFWWSRNCWLSLVNAHCLSKLMSLRVVVAYSVAGRYTSGSCNHLHGILHTSCLHTP